MRRILAGEKLERREHKVPYNGAEGLPIREEVLMRQGEVVITRNAYGAQCLNTPNVLFADVDLPEFSGDTQLPVIMVLAVLLCVAYAAYAHQIVLGLVGVVVFFWVGSALGGMKRRRFERDLPGRRQQVMEKIERFADSQSGWHLRVYETPAGYRVLAMHALFDPQNTVVEACFLALGTDPVYEMMCRNQRCFRARLTAKPWRIGMDKHLPPRPGVWPVKPERLPQRKQWVAAYEARAAGFAACRFVKRLGGTAVHPEAEAVRRLHDEISRAESGLKTA